MEDSTSPSTTPTVQLKPAKGFCLCRYLCELFLLTSFFVTLCLFALYWPYVDNVVQEIPLSKINLAPNSVGYDSWIDPPATTIRDYRLFDVTNYMDIMTNPSQTLMEFHEAGPFPYRLVVKKNNPTWSNNDTQLHYSVERFFTRHGEFSEALLNQRGAFIDILRVLLRSRFDRIASNKFYNGGGNNAFNYSNAIDKLEGFVSSLFTAVSLEMLGPNTDKYGFIYRYNGSNGFNYTIEAGSNNSSIKGQMIDFASEYTTFRTTRNNWQTTIFDGMTFPTLGNPPTRKVINVFQPDFCRPVQLRYNRTVKHLGFPYLHEYVLKLVDVEKCPQMDEHCPEADKLDISKCISSKITQPLVLLSKPHLYGHNSSWTNVNFKPDFDRHESTIYFEPITGTPIKARLRIQLNVNALIDQLKLKADGSTEPAGTPGVQRLVPMLWIDQMIDLNPDKIKSLRILNVALDTARRGHQSVKLLYVILAFIMLMLVCTMIELFIYNRRNKVDRSLIYQPSKDQEKQLLSPTKATA